MRFFFLLRQADPMGETAARTTPSLSSNVAVLKYTRKTFARFLKLELRRLCGQTQGEARRVWPVWCGVSVAEDTCPDPAEKLPVSFIGVTK